MINFLEKGRERKRGKTKRKRKKKKEEKKKKLLSKGMNILPGYLY